MVAHLKENYGHRIIIQNGSGMNQNSFWLKDLDIDNADQANALIEFHAFSGNDYVSSSPLFGKAKRSAGV